MSVFVWLAERIASPRSIPVRIVHAVRLAPFAKKRLNAEFPSRHDWVNKPCADGKSIILCNRCKLSFEFAKHRCITDCTVKGVQQMRTSFGARS